MYKTHMNSCKICFTNTEKYLRLSKSKNKFRLYYISECSDSSYLQFKNKKEVVTFLNNFSNYYGLGNFEIKSNKAYNNITELIDFTGFDSNREKAVEELIREFEEGY